MPHRRTTDTEPTDRILHSAVQSQGQRRCISTELSPDRHTGWQPILRKEVEAAVQSLKKGQSAGGNNIQAELVQAGEENVITTLMIICHKIWQTGEWLTPWTQSIVITLPKKGNLQHCQHYRTISLISHSSKVMLKPQAEEITAEPGRLQSRKEHYRADLQLTNPLWQMSPAPARPLPCLYRLQGVLRQGLACSFVGNHEVQHQHHLYPGQKKTLTRPLVLSSSTSIGDWFWTVGVQQGCLLSLIPFNIFFWKGHDRCHRRSQRHCQHWRQNNNWSPLCWWHWWLSRRKKNRQI